MNVSKLPLALAGVLLSFASWSADQPTLNAQERIEPSVERLVQYAAQGDEAMVRRLLDAGVDVAAADPSRRVTALHNVAAQGHLKLARYLLERGAPVDASDWHGVTPLVAASFYGRAPMVQLLIEKGARVDVVPAQAPTPLIAAVYSGNLATVDALLKAGANAALKDWTGTSAAEAAQRTGRTSIAARLQTKQDIAQ